VFTRIEKNFWKAEKEMQVQQMNALNTLEKGGQISSFEGER